MDDAHILTNAHVVAPDWDGPGTVVVEDGIVVDVIRGRSYRAGTDLGGCWLAPGCIDIHSDYLEREIRPRPSAEFPLPLAFHFMDQRAAACGLTTVMSAVSFSQQEDRPDERTFANAIERARFLDGLVSGALVRHFLHARIDPNTDAVLDHLGAMDAIASLLLVVYNDSVPGQRQFRFEDLVRKRADSMGLSLEDARTLLERKVAERSRVNHRGPIRDALGAGRILGSHDDTTVAHVEEAHAFGATLSEMPTTIEAARRAKELGMWVCMGAPNYVRGGSHCGNLACSDALAADCVDLLCSDYHFPSMHGAVVKMLDAGIAPSRCFELVSLNPARLLGLDDRLGSIEPGKVADLVAFEARRDFSRIARVWVDGRERLRLDVAGGLEPTAAMAEPRAAVG